MATTPCKVDKSKIFYVVEDYAGNRDAIVLSELVSAENDGRIRVALVDANTHQRCIVDLCPIGSRIAGQVCRTGQGKQINSATAAIQRDLYL